MANRLYSLEIFNLLVIRMNTNWNEAKPSAEYKSTFNRRLETQIYNNLRRDYAFPRAVCRSLTDLFQNYLDLYFGGLRKEGQIVFYAVARDVPPGVPVEEMHLIPVILTVYASEDNLVCTDSNQIGLSRHRIVRIANETYIQGGLLTQADIAIILGESTKTISRHIIELEKQGMVVPTRGRWKDIGPGESHKKRILKYYLLGDEYTDIERKTKHSSEAIMRYIKDFARLLILTEEGYSNNEIRMISGLSDKIVREYRELIDEYSGSEYKERLDHIRAIFRKKTLEEHIQEVKELDNSRRLNE